MRVPPIRCLAMRSLGTVVLASVLLTASTACAEMTLAQLQELAKEVLKNDEVSVSEPIIRIEGGSLSYYLGGAGYIFDPTNFGRPAIDAPIRNQLQIEVLRRFRGGAKNRNFWEPVFARITPMISQQLSIAQSKNLSEDKKFERLDALNEKIGQEYQRSLASYARSRGLQASRMLPYAPPFSVEFTTIPGGGKVYLLHTLEHRMAQAQGKQASWHAVDGSGPVELQGKYWYKIEWGDRSVVGNQPIHITRNGTISLR